MSVEPAATPCPACPLSSGIFNYDRCAHVLYVAHVFFALMLFHTSFAAKAKLEGTRKGRERERKEEVTVR